MKRLIIFILIFFLNAVAQAQSEKPILFLFFGPEMSLEGHGYEKILASDYVGGAQVVYTWKELEPEKDKYDFSRITNDINFLKSLHKKLFIQLQDRSFEPDLFYVPDYIRNEPEYHGGVAMQYDF